MIFPRLSFDLWNIYGNDPRFKKSEKKHWNSHEFGRSFHIPNNAAPIVVSSARTFIVVYFLLSLKHPGDLIDIS